MSAFLNLTRRRTMSKTKEASVGIVRRGLGYDWSDIGVITNIGQDDIESIEDIVNIKAFVAERVREGGTLILNVRVRVALRQ